MNTKDEQNKKGKKKEEEITKQLEKLKVCPYCHNMVEYIWVHGHYQCPKCKNIVIGCCGDI